MNRAEAKRLVRNRTGGRTQLLYTSGEYHYVGVTGGARGTKALYVVGPRGGVSRLFSFDPEEARIIGRWLT